MSENKFDMSEHEANWEGFKKFTQWSVAGIAVALILMAIFLL